MKEIIITKDERGIKFFKLIKKMFPDMPDSLIYKLLRKKYFEINSKKATGKEELKNGDKISIFLSGETIDKFKEQNEETNNLNKEKIDINRIVYEDENIIIYNKPINMLSQSNEKNKVSLNELLKEYVINTKKNNKLIKSMSVVNRLDRNTEGLIIFAKNYLVAREISKMIKEQRIEKRYKALVNGVIEREEGKLINSYNKDTKLNKASVDKVKFQGEKEIVKLEYKVIKRNKDTTLVDINLITGKSHQIRAQFSYIGHPLVCDKKYMNINLYKKNLIDHNSKSQILLCYKIKFSDFDSEELKYLNNKVFVISK